MNGDSKGVYFAYGNGTSESPFGISTPRHLYNLAWLQYNGDFNKDSNSDGVLDKQYYFEIDPNLEGSLDMTGWILPPIGTETYPFLGSFNGNNKTITNLTVSNPSSFSQKPISINYNDQTHERPEIVGFFGVVGKLNNVPTYSYATATNAVTNVTLRNLTVESKTSKTLIGLAGGYVNGVLSGVKLDGTATLDVNGQASTARTDITNRLSDYSLVGYTTKTGDSGNLYKQKLSEYYSNGVSGGDEGDDYGGSIKPSNYGRLIYDSFKAPGTGEHGLTENTSTMSNSISTVNTVTTADYKLAFSTIARTWVNGAKTYYSPYLDPDYFDTPQDGASVVTLAQNGNVLYHLKDGCYLPLKFNEDKTGTASDNTGYVVGASDGDRGVVKIASYYPSAIVNSLSNTNVSTIGNAVSDKTTTYVDTNLELLTYSIKDKQWYRIEDSHNVNRTGGETTNSYIQKYSRKSVEYLGFEKYNESRNHLQNSLENSSKIQGIHFDFKEISGQEKLTVTSNIKLRGQTYSNYELPKGSLDFNLKKTGYINFFAGTYYSSTVYNFGFFTLNHITRNGTAISSIKKISEIYQNKNWNANWVSDASDNPKFFYKYSDGSFSNIVVDKTTGEAPTDKDNLRTRAATLADRNTSVGYDGMVFDNATVLEGVIGRNGTILKQDINNVMFYFEVPVNNGEYAMGMPPTPSGISSYVGAYMIYLDIGANGDVVKTDLLKAHHITTIQSENSYPDGVDFAVKNATNAGGSSIGVFIAASSQGTITFTISDNGALITVAPVENTSQVGSYAFRGGGYGTDYNVSGLSGDPPTVAAGGTRVISIHLTTVAEVEYDIRITDVLNVNESIASSTYEINSGSGYVGSTAEGVAALSQEINLVQLRGLVTVVTLTRTTGNGGFIITYDEENSNYDGKILDIDIDLNGTTVTVGAITSEYTFYVNGVQKNANDVLMET